MFIYWPTHDALEGFFLRGSSCLGASLKHELGFLPRDCSRRFFILKGDSMFIHDFYKKGKPVLSFEVFPPKKGDGIEEITATLEEMATLKPSFISVTYGAGGERDTCRKSIQIADQLKNKNNLEPLFHLTCSVAKKKEIHTLLQELKEKNITNILALGGDQLPEDGTQPDYLYATDLIAEIKEFGGFGIGAASYPEGHMACDGEEENYDHLLLKQEAGADFFISQLFFQNNYFYRFVNKARRDGVTKPLVAGIMPILGRSQVERMIFMCGVSLPNEVIRLLNKYGAQPEELKKAGIEYALTQGEELLRNGVDGVHIYTMNQSHIAKEAMNRLAYLTL